MSEATRVSLQPEDKEDLETTVLLLTLQLKGPCVVVVAASSDELLLLTSCCRRRSLFYESHSFPRFAQLRVLIFGRTYTHIHIYTSVRVFRVAHIPVRVFGWSTYISN